MAQTAINDATTHVPGECRPADKPSIHNAFVAADACELMYRPRTNQSCGLECGVVRQSERQTLTTIEWCTFSAIAQKLHHKVHH